jgi:hypothetical protein
VPVIIWLNGGFAARKTLESVEHPVDFEGHEVV